MTDIFTDFLARTHRAIDSLVQQQHMTAPASLAQVNVEPPKDETHGDLAINAAMVLAKGAGMSPRDLAQKLVQVLQQDPDIDNIAIAGPGFINVTLKPHVLLAQVQRALTQQYDYARCAPEVVQNINIEYVSANPTGPMHVGHGRGAVVGDVVANLLEYAGHNVTREYYINDAGAQINVLAQSVELRYRQALGHDIGEIPQGCYPGEYLIAVGQQLVDKYRDTLLHMPDEARTNILKTESVAAMMQLIKQDLAAVHIYHQVFRSEKELTQTGAIEQVIDTLTKAGHVYTGVLPPPKGKPVDDYEPHAQLLFKSSAFGDDTDRPLQKANGDTTYFSADIAYHADKYARGFDTLINVWGADHGGYIKRVQAACVALHTNKQPPQVLLCQLVHLLSDGQPYKMSKRAGTFITLRDVIDEVGADVLRFMMLTRRHDASLDFDLAAVKMQSKDNPVFYVQYAHARMCSVLRNAQISDANLQRADLTLLTHPSEQSLIRLIARYPRQIRQAIAALEPHRVVLAATEAAAQFHTHWAVGNHDAGLRFIVEGNAPLTHARLALVKALSGIIATSLTLAGVTPCTQM